MYLLATSQDVQIPLIQACMDEWLHKGKDKGEASRGQERKGKANANGCSPHCAYVSAHHALVLATHRAVNRGRIFSGPALAIASAAATSEARSYEVSGTARAWNILCGNGRGGQLDRVEKGTGVIGTHHLSLATRTARIRARLAIAGSRYGLQLEGERAMATARTKRNTSYQDASGAKRGTSARGRYLNLAVNHLGPEAQIHYKDNVPREPTLFAIRRER